jgi:hypothetical protein
MKQVNMSGALDRITTGSAGVGSGISQVTAHATNGPWNHGGETEMGAESPEPRGHLAPSLAPIHPSIHP